VSDDRKPLVKIGALWKREGRNSGYVYLAGEIELNGEVFKLMVFPTNPEWKKTNSPDFEIKVEEGVGGAAKKPRAVSKPREAEVALPPLNKEGLEEFGIM
jgi:hypothetical protein